MSEDSFQKTENRFELYTGGHTAYADYRLEGGTLYIDYVFAPPELRGTGAAGRLMQHLVEVGEAEQLTLEPICGYAKSWLQRHAK